MAVTAAENFLRPPVIDSTGLTDAQIIQRWGHTPGDGDVRYDTATDAIIVYRAGTLYRVTAGLPFVREAVARPTIYKRTNFDVATAASATVTILTSGVEYLTHIPCEKGDIITGAELAAATNVAGGTQAAFWLTLRDPARNLLTVSNDLGAASLDPGATKAFTWAAVQTLAARGVYYVGLVYVGTGTPPTFRGVAGMNAFMSKTPTKAGATANTGLTVPGSTPSGATITSSGSMPFMALT